MYFADWSVNFLNYQYLSLYQGHEFEFTSLAASNFAKLVQFYISMENKDCFVNYVLVT